MENGKKRKKPAPRGKASTLEILGVRERDGKVPEKWAPHHARLTALRDHFLSKRDIRAQGAQVERPTNGEHIADAATDSYDRDWDLALASSDQNALYEIEQALDRIARGTYGRCELTGKPIEPGRLRAVPWTRFSAQAQVGLEAKGAAGRTQLGALGNYFQTEGPEAVEEDEAEEQPKRLREAA